MTSKAEKAQAATARAAGLNDPSELRAALGVEREGYVRRGLNDRVKQVDTQLKKLGQEPAPEDKCDTKTDDTAPKTTARRGSARSAVPKPSDAPKGDAGSGDDADAAAVTGD